MRASGLYLQAIKRLLQCRHAMPRARWPPVRLGAAAGAAAGALLAVASGPAPALVTVALLPAVRRDRCGRAAGGCGERCGAGGERGACAARRRRRGHAAGLRRRTASWAHCGGHSMRAHVRLAVSCGRCMLIAL